MTQLVPYSIWAVLGLTGLSLLAMVLFGLRNLTYGKANTLSLVLSGLPVLLLIVLGFVLNDWAYAGILTFLITLAMTSLSLFLSGLRGLISF